MYIQYVVRYDWYNPFLKRWEDYEMFLTSKFKARLLYWFWKYIADAPRVEMNEAQLYNNPYSNIKTKLEVK